MRHPVAMWQLRCAIERMLPSGNAVERGNEGALSPRPASASLSLVMPKAAIVQILLPLEDNDKRPYSLDSFARVRQELVDRFGGATVHLAAPAVGVWRDESRVVFDSIVLFETMVEEIDRSFWSEYRRELERRFRQHEVVVRACPMERL
jgi:hypothetical protein